MKHRYAIAHAPELRTDVEGDKLVGVAALYDNETTIGGRFRESIAPGAFKAALERNDEVVALFNHDPNYVLGRSTAGTLTLREEKDGLHYEVALNGDDPDAKRVLAKVRRGDVRGSSFAFDVEDDEIRYEDDKLPLRIIRSVRLYDVSAVTSPAYPATSVMARADGDADADVVERIEREKPKPEPKPELIDPAKARLAYAKARLRDVRCSCGKLLFRISEDARGMVEDKCDRCKELRQHVC